MVLRSLLLVLAAAMQLSAADSVDQFFRDTFEQMLRDDPQFATSIGRHEYDDRWTDWSKEGRTARREFLEERLQTANRFPTAGLSPEDKLTQRLIQYDFRSRPQSFT